MDAITWSKLLDQSSTFVLAIVLIYGAKTIIEWYRSDIQMVLETMIKLSKEQARFLTTLEDVEDELHRIKERDNLKQ